MSRTKTYTGKKLLSILKKLGFITVRIKGSHHYLRHADGRTTILPIHTNEDIGIGLFLKILKDIEVTKEEFDKFN